jgi:monoamine oxidase
VLAGVAGPGLRNGEHMNPKSCIVIGSGLSGLSAAHLLTKENWEVTVLEAENFTGGRVYSFQFPQAPELVCELGGEWIGTDHKNMIGLCKELGLERMPHRFDFFFFEDGKRGKQYRAGDWPFPASAKRKFNHLRKQTRHWGSKEKIVLDKKDWWTILRDRGFAECDLLRRDLMDSTDFGESIRQVGGYSAAAEYFDSDRFDEMDTKVVGGNIQVVRALERAITSRGGRILTCHPVTAIVQREGGVSVRTDRCGVFSAKFCICTVPARTLTKIDFHPRLPDKRWDFAKQLQYARIMKTAILCESRFWMEKKNTRFSCFTDRTSDFLFDATLGQPGEKGILCSYAIGDKADDLDAFRVEDLKAQLQSDFKRIFPEASVKIIAIQKQAWQKNKLTEGAYALYRPGQWFTVREELARPFKKVYFAGEHIADEQGFMDGALDTGQAAARSILRA